MEKKKWILKSYSGMNAVMRLMVSNFGIVVVCICNTLVDIERQTNNHLDTNGSE